MELRSSRSRSKTPIVLLTKIEKQIATEQFSTVIEEEHLTQHSYSTRQKTQKVNNELLPPVKTKTEKTVKKTRHKTSDYSSEDGENEITSSRKLETENYTSSSNGGIKSAFQVYKEAGEYWNKYPKTDYTYSVHSKDRMELAPGVIAMPNMSRRSLRRSMEPTTLSSSSSSVDHRSTKTANYFTGSVGHSVVDHYNDYGYKNDRYKSLERRALFKDYYSDAEDEYDGDHKIERISTISTFFRRIKSTTITRIMMSFISILSVVYFNGINSVKWFGRAYYKAVSKLFLFDTWLTNKRNHSIHSESIGSKRIGPFFALLFLPLLLLLGWWTYSGLYPILLGALNTTDNYFKRSTINQDELSKIILPTSDSNEKNVNLDDIVKLLLSNPELEKIIITHINSKTAGFEEKIGTVNTLKSEINIVNKRLEDLDSNLRMEIARNNAKFGLELNKCCKRQFIYIEAYVKKLLSDLLGIPNVNLQPDDITNWLNTIFVAKHELELKLNNITQNMNSDFEMLVEKSAAKIMDQVSDKINIKLKEYAVANENLKIQGSVNSALPDADIYRIVKQAIATYDADKTGLVDYALEPSGGQIISTRCTENYNFRTAVVSVLGIPLWYPSNTPRVIITPGVTPGECWAFQNFPGFVVIQLAGYVDISAFSLEHIPKSLAPGGVRDSAPKGFSVFGLKAENDREPFEFGSYEYDLEQDSLQFFAVINKAGPFNMIELRVDSNHGNLNYTCLYRFRVHGVLSNEPT